MWIELAVTDHRKAFQLKRILFYTFFFSGEIKLRSNQTLFPKFNHKKIKKK